MSQRLYFFGIINQKLKFRFLTTICLSRALSSIINVLDFIFSQGIIEEHKLINLERGIMAIIVRVIATHNSSTISRVIGRHIVRRGSAASLFTIHIYPDPWIRVGSKIIHYIVIPFCRVCRDLNQRSAGFWEQPKPVKDKKDNKYGSIDHERFLLLFSSRKPDVVILTDLVFLGPP